VRECHTPYKHRVEYGLEEACRGIESPFTQKGEALDSDGQTEIRPTTPLRYQAEPNGNDNGKFKRYL